ncbi:L,D-transpeptidase family protein [Halomonas sp. McH1-25]|uniref:L,D-transpeptidase family protein n=1 Tax=unclassified Halomonas TaxID=2609666 RepID=UPI001EF4233E|nr:MULTISPECIES: L,D-transpeptidase family protein [unclassified Halomonas]MCG7600909.1 L,D-transpeptidase family protein [Halomonas sp. McH1-25]MCP1341497.1 L,D-transpeptidase family protein [Halomonas sp. FL8]MCP1360088.1 L,D-transpeptidase family protein [Halomonas sp. BBD45]MCP1364024.1 L,D-transpeptidase family protein [Halomonas sp. BBD48]
MTPRGLLPGFLLLLICLTIASVQGDDAIPKEGIKALIIGQEGDGDSLLRQVYEERDFEPAWNDEATLAAFIEALPSLADDGLDPADYAVNILQEVYRQVQATGTALQRARFDVNATRTFLLALRHLQRGKVDPYAIYARWEVPIAEATLAPSDVSNTIDTRQFAQAFADARPAYPPYEHLRSALAKYRRIQALGGWPMLPSRDQSLQPGETHEDVLLLRQRLAMIGETMLSPTNAPDMLPTRYDEALAAAVRRFQKRHLLQADGIVGPRTRAALNVPVGTRIDQIRVNLERARWLLHELPDTFVLVDIAGYRLSYFRPDGRVWRTRIVVGQPYRQTPSLRSEITHVTVNPTWTIPPTILRQDVLPQVRRDPGYLVRHRIQVLDGSGYRLDPFTIDWTRPGNVILRQVAGPGNALGQVVIRFPNQHLVYLHDTPAQALFAQEQRAFSSGCIRVQQVLELVQHLFDDTGTDQHLASLVATGQTRNVPLSRTAPLILSYWTAQADEAGFVTFRPDIYQRDAPLLAALDRPFILPDMRPAFHASDQATND